jgi:hypothetical protein
LRIVKHLMFGIVVLLVGVQLVRPARTNPPATNPLAIGDPRVESILRRSCFDCHSNETRWPWYSEVAPVSWQIARHVNDGRKKVNFSDWNEEKAAKRLEEICEETKEGEMPVRGYLLLHREAVLSAEDVGALCGWSSSRLARSAGR